MTRIGMAIDPDRLQVIERRRRRRETVLAWTSGVAALALLATSGWYLDQRAVSTPVDEAALLAEFDQLGGAEADPVALPPATAPAPPVVESGTSPATASPDTEAEGQPAPASDSPEGDEAAAPTSGTSDTGATSPAAGPSARPAASAAQPTPVFGLPADGVYAYRTEGYETVSLGGSRHDYPERTFAIVEAEGGCQWSFDHRILEEKRARNTYCHDGPEHRAVSYDGWVTFFGQTSEQHYTCEGVRARADDRDGATHRSTCFDDSARTDDRTTFLGVAPIDIGGTVVQALSYRIDTVVTGSVEGESTQKLWLHPEMGMILRLERDTATSAYEFGAQVDYVEHAVFELESLTPRR